MFINIFRFHSLVCQVWHGRQALLSLRTFAFVVLLTCLRLTINCHSCPLLLHVIVLRLGFVTLLCKWFQIIRLSPCRMWIRQRFCSRRCRALNFGVKATLRDRLEASSSLCLWEFCELAMSVFITSMIQVSRNTFIIVVCILHPTRALKLRYSVECSGMSLMVYVGCCSDMRVWGVTVVSYSVLAVWMSWVAPQGVMRLVSLGRSLLCCPTWTFIVFTVKLWIEQTRSLGCGTADRTVSKASCGTHLQHQCSEVWVIELACEFRTHLGNGGTLLHTHSMSIQGFVCWGRWDGAHCNLVRPWTLKVTGMTHYTNELCLSCTSLFV